MNKVAGIVTIYNPGEDIIHNIESYLHQIDKLYLIDNSEQENFNLKNYMNEIDEIVSFTNRHYIGCDYSSILYNPITKVVVAILSPTICQVCLRTIQQLTYR